MLLLALAAAAQAACTVTLDVPLDGDVASTAPTFSWSGDCDEYRVQLSPDGVVRRSSPWTTNTSMTAPSAWWDTATANLPSGGVWWRVQGEDAAGVRTNSAMRWLVVDHDLDDDGVDRFTDCDDADPDVFPGAVDRCDDAIDADCDGVDAVCAYTLATSVDLEASRAAKLTGYDDDDEGQPIAWPALAPEIAIVTNAGRPSLVLGAPEADYHLGGKDETDVGAVFVLPGLPRGDLLLGDTGYLGWGGDRFGAGLAAIDQDGDGLDDLVIGAPGLASLTTLPGYTDWSGYASDQGLCALDAADEPGEALATAGDVDWDGAEDLFVGAPGATIAGLVDAGAIHVFAGQPLEAELPVSLATVEGDVAGARLGERLVSGDLDGDGWIDLVASTVDERVLVFYGPVIGTISANLADAVITVEVAGDGPAAGLAIGPDIDGDTLPDLIVGVPGATGGVGAAYVVPLPLGASSLATAPIIVRGDAAGDQLGASVAATRDLDGDGTAELLLGAPGASKAWIAPSVAAGVHVVSAVGVPFVGKTGDRAGANVAAGDLDGDQVPEIVVGAPRSGRNSGGNPGAVYVLERVTSHVWDCVGACDGDGDGFDGVPARGGDCDDYDPLVFPGAGELCDGIDNDCDGLVDAADPDIVGAGFLDADGDGYGTWHETPACPGPGWSATADDCNDADPTRNPATLWGQDLDRDGYGDPAASVAACWSPGPDHVANVDDCDDADANQGPLTMFWADADADGYGDGVEVAGPACVAPAANQAPAWAGLDCDDADGLVSPGGFDACGDGIDGDCDGADPVCVPLVGLVKASDASAVISLAGDVVDARVIGDLDHDGRDDVAAEELAANRSRVDVLTDFAVRGEHVGRSLGAVLVTNDDANWLKRFQPAYVAADLTGDGLNDLAVTWLSETYVFAGPVPQAVTPADAVTTLHRNLDWFIADEPDLRARDLDADGAVDLIFTAVESAVGLTQRDVIHVLHAPSLGDLDVSDSTLQIELPGEHWLGSPPGFGDLDGDGIQEIALGTSPAVSGDGAVRIIAGDRTGVVKAATGADASVLGVAGVAGAFGAAAGALGDVDGDGLDDLFAAAPVEAGGAVYLISGGSVAAGAAPTVDTIAMATIRGDATGSVVTWPMELTGVGDVDGDGRRDLAVPVLGAESRICLAYELAAGAWTPSTLPACITGETETFGENVESGDFDGDGRSDLLISDDSDLLLFFSE